MRENEALRFRPGDGAAIAAVVLLAAALLAGFLFFAGGGEAKILRIYQDGKPVGEMPLDRDGETRVGGAYENLIRVRDGRAAIAESSCPGADCVHAGWISQPGRSVICLPNRVEIRIEGGESAGDVDAVVR